MSFKGRRVPPSSTEISVFVPAPSTSLVSGSKGTLRGADAVVEAGMGLVGLVARVVTAGCFGGMGLTSVVGIFSCVGVISGAAMVEIWVRGKTTGHFSED